MVPNIELAAQSGCKIGYDGDRCGWIPIIDADMRTSIPYIYVIGDGAGVQEPMPLSTGLAEQQALRAVAAIADGRPVEASAASSAPAQQTPPAAAQWLRALVATGGLDVIACLCEEVTRAEILGVKAPRYLGAAERSRAGRVSPENLNSQDFVKRMTRAGMGHCQGKRCRDHMAMLLAASDDRPLSQVVPFTFRAPVRPLPLGVAAGLDESEEITRTWPIWFQPLHEGEIG
jgi:hypothetical protein